MDKKIEPVPAPAPVYQITLAGRIDSERSEWFGGLEIQHEEGITTLTGPLADQQALYGIIERVRDLGLYLLAVRRVS